jgi:hypothetical protein
MQFLCQAVVILRVALGVAIGSTSGATMGPITPISFAPSARTGQQEGTGGDIHHGGSQEDHPTYSIPTYSEASICMPVVRITLVTCPVKSLNVL